MDQDTLARIHAYAWVGVTQRKPGGHLPCKPGSACETCWTQWEQIEADFRLTYDLSEPIYRDAFLIIEQWYTAASMHLVVVTPWSYDPTQLPEPTKVQR
ncbi:hypothetical protein [Geodermatophilus sp. SYSU D00079]